MSGQALPPAGGSELPSRRAFVPPPAAGGAGGSTLPPARSAGDDEVDLRELWAILRRNWWIVAGGTALGLVAALGYTELATPVYRASTTLQFQPNGGTVPVLDALRDLQGGTEVGTEMELLRSRSLAEAVIDSLGLQVLVSGPRGVRRSDALAAVQADADAPKGRVRLDRGKDGRFVASLVEGKAPGETLTAAPGEPLRLPGATVVLAPRAATLDRIDLEILPRTIAAERFGKALRVSRPNRDANVVQVRFDSPDPELAPEVANVLAYRYLVRRSAVRKVSDRSTIEFLRAQVDTLQVQLRAAEEAVRRFREQNRVVSLEAEARTQVERLAALQARRADLETERQALAGLLAETRVAAGPAAEGPSPYRRLLAFPTLLRNQTTSTLLQALTARETELAQLRARRTPADPDALAVAGQLQALEEQATAVVTTYLDGLANQVEAIDRELRGFGQQLAGVPAREVEYARMQRSAGVLAEMYTLLQTRLKEAEVVEAVADASVRVVDAAVVGERPISPNGRLLIPLISLSGLLVGVSLGYARDRWAGVVHSEADLRAVVSAPIVGMIPRSARQAPRPSRGEPDNVTKAGALAGSAGPAPLIEPQGLIAEAFRALRTNLSFLLPQHRPSVVLLTSPAQGDGKSLVALNLAHVMAQQGRSVVLVDADLRRGGLHELLGVPAAPGLSEWLAGEGATQVPLRFVDSPNGRFAVLTRGTRPPNPSELVGGPAMTRLLADLALGHDVVLLDSSPLSAVTDPAVLSGHADGVLLVVRAGKTTHQELRYAQKELEMIGAPVLGVLLNDIHGELRSTYVGAYQYE